MLLTSTEPEPRIVTDYEFAFTNGISYTLEVDLDSGDTIDWATNPSVVIIGRAARPSSTEVGIMIPAQETTIFVASLISVTKQTRTITSATTEQKIEFQNILEDLAKGVH